jgi:WD40 repeat protein
MVKTLDPNLPELRESLFPLVTINFAELVHAYPNISFHSPSQRLAVGCLEGITIIYDLRSATKVGVLEGHQKSVSAVSFSADGKLIATFSVEENCLKFWQPFSGFLGSLVGALGGSSGQATGVALANLSKIKPYRTFNVGPPQTDVSLSACLDEINFTWLNDRGIKLKSINGVELVFNV